MSFQVPSFKWSNLKFRDFSLRLWIESIRCIKIWLRKWVFAIPGDKSCVMAKTLRILTSCASFTTSAFRIVDGFFKMQSCVYVLFSRHLDLINTVGAVLRLVSGCAITNVDIYFIIKDCIKIGEIIFDCFNYGLRPLIHNEILKNFNFLRFGNGVTWW